MRRLACIVTLSLMPFAAGAEVTFQEVQGEAHIAVLTMNNLQEMGVLTPRFWTFDLPEGEVRVREVITRNIDCDTPCPDEMYIESLPVGVVADRIQIIVEEGGVGIILLYPQLLG